MATLTAAKRKKLPKSSFALGGGRYPIHDAAHARNALARVAQHGSPREQAIVRAAVKRRYPAIGQAGKKAQIRKAFGAKAKARGMSLSAAQLAVIDLAVDAGYLDLAGKWRHGWIPLDGAALASKRHGRKGGSLSHYHGGKAPSPSRAGKGRAGSSVTSAIQVGKGGRGKSGLSAPKTATVRRLGAEKRQALNRRAGAHTVPVTRRSKPAAPSTAQRDANLGALEVRKAGHGRGYDVVHKPSGKKIGGSHGTQRAAETTRRTVADTHHDLTGNESTITGNPAVMKHIRGSVEQARQAENERASTAAAAARARKALPTGGGKLTNPSRPGDLAVFSKTHADYQIGKPASSHEEHTPVRLTHVSKEGHAIGGYDAAGHYRTIDNRTTTRVLPQDKVDVHAFMEHIKQTNRWHAGSDSVKPHYGSLEETQRAAKQFAKQPSSPPKVDKMSTRGENRGMTSTEKQGDFPRLHGMSDATAQRLSTQSGTIGQIGKQEVARRGLTPHKHVQGYGPHPTKKAEDIKPGDVRVFNGPTAGHVTKVERNGNVVHITTNQKGVEYTQKHRVGTDLPTRTGEAKPSSAKVTTGFVDRKGTNFESPQNYSEMRKIAEARYGKPAAPNPPAKPSAPASHITAQEATFNPTGRNRQPVSQMSAIDKADHQDRLEQAVSNREQLAKARSALAQFQHRKDSSAASYTHEKQLKRKVGEFAQHVKGDIADGYAKPSALARPAPEPHRLTADEAFRMNKTNLQAHAAQGDPVASAELARRASKRGRYGTKH